MTMSLHFIVAPPKFNPIGCTLTLTADDGSGPVQVQVDPDVLAFVAGMPVNNANDALTALAGHVGRIQSAAERALERTGPGEGRINVQLCDIEARATAPA
jgi:hypothetical protein